MIYELPRAAVYSLDTGCLINAWQKNYPPDMFEPIWHHLDGLIAREIVVASAEVLHELERQDDDLCAWCDDRDDMFIDLIDPLQTEVATIMRDYPKLVATGRNVARLRAERLVVVTEETPHRARVETH